MTDQAAIELFKKEILDCLGETFEKVRGIYLDRGASLFETLEGVSAEDASRPAAADTATLAAQVAHVRFYLDVLDDSMRREEVAKVDWREIWQGVRAVTPEEWDAARRGLRESYERVLKTIQDFDRWEGEYGIAGSLAVLTHTAYHLGGIRTTLAVIRATKQRG